MKNRSAAVLLGWLAAMAALAADAPDTLQPFTAVYAVKYSALSVGTSRLELRRDTAPGQWVVESTASASGLARLIASGPVRQKSWLVVDDAAVRPLRFRFDDGMARTEEDLSLDFDWAAGRVTGTAKGKLVDLATEPNAQDPVSIQIATMVALMRGAALGEIPLIEGPRVKRYAYRYEGSERLDTEAGTFDTVVYRSSREGSDRETRLWLAPALGYLAVQAEQQRRGRRLFSMYLKRYVPGG